MKYFLIAFLISVEFISNSYAEYNSYKMGQAIGSYITAAINLNQLKESPCGYLACKTIPIQRIVDESKLYLMPTDRKELLDGINKMLPGIKLDADRFINEFLEKTSQKYSTKTACGMLLQNAKQNYSNITGKGDGCRNSLSERLRKLDKMLCEQEDRAKKKMLESESILDKLKRKASPRSYWQGKKDEYENDIKLIKGRIRDSRLELERLKATKDIELRQAVNEARMYGDDIYQAKRDFFEYYKEDVRLTREFIKEDTAILKEFEVYLRVAKNELAELK